jgi:hypothetical protein
MDGGLAKPLGLLTQESMFVKTAGQSVAVYAFTKIQSKP